MVRNRRKVLLPDFSSPKVDIMNEYDIKRGHYEKVEGDKLKIIMKDSFESVKKEGDKLVSNFGALEKITVWLEGKKILFVETKMNTDVEDNVATETIRKYNQFLERATGFTAKERRKRTSK
jgi:hypothetical protein